MSSGMGVPSLVIMRVLSCLGAAAVVFVVVVAGLEGVVAFLDFA